MNFVSVTNRDITTAQQLLLRYLLNLLKTTRSLLAQCVRCTVYARTLMCRPCIFCYFQTYISGCTLYTLYTNACARTHFTHKRKWFVKHSYKLYLIWQRNIFNFFYVLPFGFASLFGKYDKRYTLLHNVVATLVFFSVFIIVTMILMLR